MSDAVYLVAACGLVLFLLAGLAAIADAWESRERRDARRRNRR